VVTEFKIVIPARYESTRFPGKPLAPICGVPMILHACERAAASGAGEVVVATDSQQIREVCEGAGVDVCMTASTHTTGTDRIAEVTAVRGWADDTIVVNVQGDEPLLPASVIQQVAGNLQANPIAAIATLATPIGNRAEADDPNVVKVVYDADGMALYFSRALIPACRDADWAVGHTYRHIGLYAFRGSFLRRFSVMQPSTLEQLEKLEQLRALSHGDRIHVALAVSLPGPGVDTPEQLREVEAIMEAQR
jgi:3-deoxy-manno-octulosonate cytidylyltransferase (CMP-KDO synthetase)